MGLTHLLRALITSRVVKESVESLGAGIVYLGGSRIPPGGELYTKCRDLACSLGTLLEVPAWLSGGTGADQAVSAGASEAGCRVGAIALADWRVSGAGHGRGAKPKPRRDNPLHYLSAHVKLPSSRNIGLVSHTHALSPPRRPAPPPRRPASSS